MLIAEFIKVDAGPDNGETFETKTIHFLKSTHTHTHTPDQLNWIQVNYRVALESGFQFSSWHDFKGELWLDTYLGGPKQTK